MSKHDPTCETAPFAEGLYCVPQQRTYRFRDMRGYSNRLRLITIGRGDKCNIQIDDPAAASIHATLELQESGAMQIYGVLGGTVYVNEQRLPDAIVVTEGMKIRIGDTLFFGADAQGLVAIRARTFSEMSRLAAKIYGSDKAAADRLGPSGEFIRRQRHREHTSYTSLSPASGLYCCATNQVYPFDGLDRLTIGRKRGCDIQVGDPMMSDVHAIIERDGDGSMVIRDNDSRRGIRIEETLIDAPATLTVGMKVIIGETRFIGADRRGRVPVTGKTISELARRGSWLYGSLRRAARFLNRSRGYLTRLHLPRSQRKGLGNGKGQDKDKE